jgi:glycosyltransferase involved in cell wall biosynthesis
MRVLLLNTDPDPPTEGLESRASHMRGVASGLLRAGHRVEGALAARVEHAALQPLESRGLTLHALPRLAGRDALDRLMAACRPDVVIERMAPCAPHGAEVAARLGVPHVYEILATPGKPSARAGRRDSADEFEDSIRRGLAASRGAVVRSADLADWIRQRASADFEVTVFPAQPEGSELNDLDPAHLEWARALIEARPAELVIGFCGSFKPWHDLDTLVGAAARLGEGRVRLVLAGDGPSRNALLRLTHQLRVPAVFAGALERPEARALMGSCDVIALPYARSGADFSPVKLVEAMTLARPIVATETGSTRRVLGDGSLGLLVPAGDLVAMAGAFEKLATQSDLRERLSDAVRRRAVEHYSWDVAAERLLAFARARRDTTQHCA